MLPESKPDPIETPGAGLEAIEEANKQSVNTMHSLLQEMKIVQEHESIVLEEDAEPPLFVTDPAGGSSGRIP